MDIIKLPKIELHCHLDGSLRPETIVDIAKKENISLPSYDAEFIKGEIIAPAECTCLDEYLRVFDIPNLVMQSRESLKRVTYELFEDAAKENVKYLEVRFAPFLHTAKGLAVEEIIESVIEGMRAAEKDFDIRGNIILSTLRIMPVETAFELVEKGRKYLGKGVAALDLAGPERENFSESFMGPVALAREYGYRITIHAGETAIGKNVLDAIELLGAERIGHGVHAKDCLEAYNAVKEKGVTLEMCPTSNVQTKSVNSYSEHPIYDYLKDGIKVTINTDNRTVSDTDMSRECSVVFKEFNISEEDYRKIYLNSVEASFADEATKERLRKYI